MPTGLGRAPLGTSPYGFGTPDAAPVLGGAPLVRPADGGRPGSRSIDPATGQYVYGADGRIEGMSDMQQMVYLAVKTDAGSAWDPSLGDDRSQLRDVTVNFAQRREASLRTALAHLTGPGLITILSVDVVRVGESRVDTTLRWKDLTTGNEHDLRVP